MVRSNLRMLAVAVCLAGVSCVRDLAAKGPASDPKAIDGLWSGAWGGGDRNGIVFQPVMAELFIKGDHVELYGFPDVNALTGTIQIDASARRMLIAPAAETGREIAKAIVYADEMKGDELTLTESNKSSISLHKHRVAQDPLANARATSSPSIAH